MGRYKFMGDKWDKFTGREPVIKSYTIMSAQSMAQLYYLSMCIVFSCVMCCGSDNTMGKK